MSDPILLSPPHLSGREQAYLADALESNWIAPLGPHVDAFEKEFAATVGAPAAAALSSGTAALHLALVLCGVRRGDDVLVSTLTFAGSIYPIVYLGARPVFIDSERASWNLDPALVRQELESRARRGCLPRAVVAVHLYGQTADLDPIIEACDAFDVPLIEDAAEALGARYRGRAPGTLGRVGIYSFNGNKIITTSGGGMLVADSPELVERARFLAAQAREPAAHYQHEQIGYNYRLSNLLAAVGRAQLEVLEQRVEARRENFEHYESALADLPGLSFMPEAAWGLHTRWLTTLTVEPEASGYTRDQVCQSLAEARIEARPVWKPMHQQPVFGGCEVCGGAVADDLFAKGLCLPSGSALAARDRMRVVDVIRAIAER